MLVSELVSSFFKTKWGRGISFNRFRGVVICLRKSLEASLDAENSVSKRSQIKAKPIQHRPILGSV